MTKNNSALIKKEIFKKSLIIIISTTFIFFVISLLINNIQPDWIRFFGKMNGQLIQTAKIASVIFIGFFFINMPFGVVSNSFSAYKKAYISNLFNVMLSILLFISLLIIIIFKGNLIQYAILYGCITLFVNILKCIIYFLISRSYSLPSINDEITMDNTYRSIIITGGRLCLYGIAIMISSNISNLIISNSINVASVTPYQLTYRVLFFAFTILTSINLSAAPLYGKEFANKNWKWLVDKYETFFIISVVIGGAIWLGGMLFLKDIIFQWVGDQGYAGILTVILLGAWIFSYCLYNLNCIVVNSFNYTKGVALISWSETLIFLLSSIFLIKYIGIAGVAAGLLIASLLVNQWAMPLMLYRKSGGKLKYNYKILLTVLSAFIIFVPISYLQQIYTEEWYIRILTGIFIFTIYLILCYKIIPKKIIFELISKLFSKKMFTDRA